MGSVTIKDIAQLACITYNGIPRSQWKPFGQRRDPSKIRLLAEA